MSELFTAEDFNADGSLRTEQAPLFSEADFNPDGSLKTQGPLRQAAGRFTQGLAGMLAGVPEGVAILADKIGQALPFLDEGKPLQELDTYKLGRAMRAKAQDLAPVDETRPRSFLTDTLPQGAGSLVGAVTGGVAGRTAKLPVWVATAFTGAAAGGADAYDEAIQSGGTEDQAWTAFLINAGAGTTEAVPIARWLSGANRASGGRLRRALKEGGEEAVQEVFQQLTSNVTASKLAGYDPERPWYSGTGEGGAAGMTLGTLASLLIPGRERGTARPAPATPEKKPLFTAEDFEEDGSVKTEPAPEPKVPVTRALAADLQAAMQGNQLAQAEPEKAAETKPPTAESVPKSVQVEDELLQQALADLPAEARQEIEARLAAEDEARMEDGGSKMEAEVPPTADSNSISSSLTVPPEVQAAADAWSGAEKRYRRARRQEPSDVEDASEARQEAEIEFRVTAEKHNLSQDQFDQLSAQAKSLDTDQMPELTEPPEGETTALAAPDTQTGGTATELATPAGSTPTQKGVPLEGETIPVEVGETPTRSAAPLAGEATGKRSRPFYTNQRPHDLIDEIEGHYGKISWKLIKEANPDWKPTGAARKIFAAEGEPADTAAQAMFETHLFKGDPGQVDQFGDAVNDAARARIGFRQQNARENRAAKQAGDFQTAIARRGPDQQPIISDDLQPGDKLKIRGVPFEVSELEFDEAAEALYQKSYGEIAPAQKGGVPVDADRHRESQAATPSGVGRESSTVPGRTGAAQPAVPGARADAPARGGDVAGRVAAVEKAFAEAEQRRAEASAKAEAAKVEPLPEAEAPQPDAPEADPILDALEKLKFKAGEGGQMHAFGLLPAAWDQLIDLVKLGVRAGRSLRDAIGWAVEKFKARNPDAKLDEAGATEYLMTSDEAAPLREQFADERDQGRITDEEAEAAAAGVSPSEPERKPKVGESPTSFEQLRRRKANAPEFSGRDPEMRLSLARLKAEWKKAVDAKDWERVKTLNGQMDELLAKPDAGDRVTVDVERSPAETADLIAGTVDALNAVQEEISTLKARSQAVPSDLNKLRNDLRARLNVLKGWSDDQTDQQAAGGVRKDKPAAASPENRLRQMTLEAATNPERATFNQFWDALKRGLRYLTSPIPELPLTGALARRSALFRRGFRLFTAETNRVREEAAAKVKQVLEPLEKLRSREQNNALKRYFDLGTRLERARQAGDDRKIDALAKQLAALEVQVNKDPFNLFRKTVLYRDLWWRGTYLKTEDGKPITLPNGLSIEEVAAELRSLTQQLDAHADKAAITDTLKRHYALTHELQESIIQHGEIIPEALRNPLYFPHHILEYWTGRIDRVRPSTEEDFRRYLIAPVGSGKLVQADYLKAMYVHTADVLAHNARVDLVRKYWQVYDVSERLKAEHGEAWDKPWNLPAGYKLFAPFKKLPLRMDYILTREVLADQLGVLFNDGDLRARAGEAGAVLKVKPEDLHAAMVAGEKIKWALPVEIADALSGIAERELQRSHPGLGHALGAPARGLNMFWKRVKLFAPWNWIRYEYGNLTTDLVDKVLVADPKVATYLKQAAREVLTASHKGTKSAAFKAASREGVFDTITASEAGELQRLREFSEFATTNENARSTVHNFLAATTKASHFREATFRYAKFLADVERMQAGQLPVYAGAYHEDIEALGDTIEGQQQMLQGDELMFAKAAEISLKTFGDYNSLGVVSQWLRTYAIPFWSWQDVNFRYHANQLRNIADGLKGIRGGTQRDVALKYAAVRVVTTLTAVAIAQQLWNTFGGPLLGLWDDDDDLESQLSEADRRRSHIILGKDENGQLKVVYTPSAFADVAEWAGGLNMKRLFVEYAQGQITLEQFIKDYAKQLPADTLNKFAQSVGPIGKAPYETISGKATFPDVLDQRSIPKADRWWRLVGTMTDDRAVNWLRQVFDQDYYSQPARDQLQQIILQVRRRDPEQWAYYEAREAAADWKEAKTGKRFEAGSYDAPEAQVLRNFRRAIYRADVAGAEQFYKRLLDYGYTAERLDASIRAQHPLSDLNQEARKEYLAALDARGKRELALAEAYYSRLSGLDRRERQLFPTNYRQRAIQRGTGTPFEPKPELLREIMERRKTAGAR